MKTHLSLHDAFETLFWDDNGAFETTELASQTEEMIDGFITPSEQDMFTSRYYEVLKNYQERAFELGYRTALNLFFVGIVPRDYNDN